MPYDSPEDQQAVGAALPDTWAKLRKLHANAMAAPNAPGAIDYTNPEMQSPAGAPPPQGPAPPIAPPAPPAPPQAPAGPPQPGEPLVGPGSRPPKPPGQPIGWQNTPEAGGMAQPAPTRVIPQHWVQTMAPENRAEMSAAEKLQLEGVQRKSEEESKGQLAQAETYSKLRDDLSHFETDYQAQYEKQQKDLMNHREALDARSKALLARQIDPQHLYKERGTFATIAMVIGAGLSAAGHALTHTPDDYMQMINGAIDRDINAQQHSIEQDKEGLARENSLLAEKYRMFGDWQKARIAAKQEMIQGAQFTLQEQAARYGASANLANAQVIAGGLQRDMAQLHAEHNKFVPQQVAGGTGGIGEKEQGLVFQDAATGQSYKAPNEAALKELTTSATAAENVKRLSREYVAASAELSDSDRLAYKLGYTTKKMGAAETIYNQLLSDTRKEQKDGVWRKAQVPQFEKILNPPDKMLGNQAAEQSRVISEMADRAHQSVMATHNALPVRQGWTRDAAGNLKPTAAYTGQRYQPKQQAPMPWQTQIGGQQ